MLCRLAWLIRPHVCGIRYDAGQSWTSRACADPIVFRAFQVDIDSHARLLKTKSGDLAIVDVTKSGSAQTAILRIRTPAH